MQRGTAGKSTWLFVLILAAGLRLAEAQVTPTDRTEFVAGHNAIREDAIPWPFPSLAPLGWSATRETASQTHAAGCAFQHSAGAILGQYGENLYASSSTEVVVPRPSAATATAEWGAENADYDYATNSCAPFPAQCGHYTQIVLRAATLVGCGIQECLPATSPFLPPFNTHNWWIWVCQYDSPQTSSRPYMCDYGAGSVVCDNRGVFRDGLESGSLGRWSALTPE